MYQCHVEKRVWRNTDHSHGCTRLFFDLEVEAAPEVGYELNVDRWFSGPLGFVTWDNEKQRFVCSVSDEYPSRDRDYTYSYEWIVENYLLQGWHANDG